MEARAVSGRRQIHRYISELLERPSPLASPTGVTVPSSVLPSDSGNTSSKRRKKSNGSVHQHEEGSPEPASAPVAPPDGRVRMRRTAVGNVTVCDADALDCGVCFLALKAPIFQCEVGHVVCSSCRDKLEVTGTGKCHLCGVATRGRYRRCHAMEHLLDCIRVPCPFAAHGCDATPPFHGKESHRQVCPHAPCHCPGGESCGFIGSTAALMDHFAGAHSWPCTTKKVSAGEAAFSIRLHVGFNFLLLASKNHYAGADGDLQVAAPCLFLLNVTQERLGRAISVICIHPHATATAPATSSMSTRCELAFARYAGSLSSEFQVVRTDLSGGLPSPDVCFQFMVPNAVFGHDDKDIEVKFRIAIN